VEDAGYPGSGFGSGGGVNPDSATPIKLSLPLTLLAAVKMFIIDPPNGDHTSYSLVAAVSTTANPVSEKQNIVSCDHV